MKEPGTAKAALNVTLRIKEFAIPPIRDALILGKSAPIGATAMKKSLALLHVSEFYHIKVRDDDVIGDIFVRSNILKRISRKQLLQLTLERVKPVMSDDEVMHLDIQAELVMEDQL